MIQLWNDNKTGGYYIPYDLFKYFPMHMRYGLEEYQDKCRFYGDEYKKGEI